MKLEQSIQNDSRACSSKHTSVPPWTWCSLKIFSNCYMLGPLRHSKTSGALSVLKSCGMINWTLKCLSLLPGTLNFCRCFWFSVFCSRPLLSVERSTAGSGLNFVGCDKVFSSWDVLEKGWCLTRGEGTGWRSLKLAMLSRLIIIYPGMWGAFLRCYKSVSKLNAARGQHADDWIDLKYNCRG